MKTCRPARLLRTLPFAASTLLTLALPHFAAADNLLLIPDISTTTGKRVLAFSPVDGSLVNANFIPRDAVHLTSPKDVVPSGNGTLLVSDQVMNAVYEYSYSGAYLRTVTSQATSGIQNLRGLAVHNNQIYVTVGAGTLTNTVQTFAMDGTALGAFATSHFNSPYDIIFRSGDALISNQGTNTIDRYDLSGNYLSTFPASGVKFPQQITQEASGNLLVGGFSAPAGIYEFDASGNKVGLYSGASLFPRGAYELGNGNVLFTDGTSVREYNRATNAITTSFTGGNFNYIQLANVTPEPGIAALLAAGSLASCFALRRRK